MNNKNENPEKQPIKYWLVEIALTSGEILNFYVKARNQKEANEKADDYAILTGNEKLKNKMKQFALLP